MSGGPVMTEDGLVRGVICSTLKTQDELAGHTSYASLVAPAMLLQIESLDRPGGQKAVRFLWDFVTGGAVVADSTNVKVERLEGECRLLLQGSRIINKIGA
jgi:hypothetical protein